MPIESNSFKVFIYVFECKIYNAGLGLSNEMIKYLFLTTNDSFLMLHQIYIRLENGMTHW